MNIPNLLTLSRIGLIPFFLYFLAEGRNTAALIIFFIGSITDALDGYLARKLGQITQMGKHLDPAADKIFLVTSYTAFYLLDMIPLWLFLIAILKDIVILAGLAALYLVIKVVEMRPTPEGKASTAFQMITVLLILLQGVGIGYENILFASMIITALLLFYSMVTYIFMGINMYRESGT